MDILIVDDEKGIRDTTSIAIEDEGHYTETASDATVAMIKLKEEQFDLVLLDINLGDENGLDILPEIRKRYPKTAVVVFTANASIKTAVEATKQGAMDYFEKPFTPDQLRGILARAQKFTQLESRVEELETQVAHSTPRLEFESEDPVMRDLYEQLFRAADSPATILILGESGTGKSVAARAAHERSHRPKKPFVTVSCPSLSKELLESELFGHIKGAFTGAIKDQWGKVKAAEGGTLFLDEIGDLPMEIQPKLLRLLQEREYERLGENKTRQANVRIIAATNRNLHDLVEAGEFREDLYYRLNVITVQMPPLRARPRDLEHFAEIFIRHFSKEMQRSVKGLSKAAHQFLMSYDWPGNLRELRNALERAVILARGKEIEPSDLPSGNDSVMNSSEGTNSSASQVLPGALVSLEKIEGEHIRKVVEKTSSLTEAAEVLEIDQATLYRKRKKLGVV
ncbi:MAG: NtrC-family two-component system response regulator AlgB [Verrucomicrobiales bacterium]|jgi:NtrC-family two-component system response regulator AlgB